MYRIALALTAVFALAACSIDHPTKAPAPTKDVPPASQPQKSSPPAAQTTPAAPATTTAPQSQATVTPITPAATVTPTAPATPATPSTAAALTNVPLFSDILCGEFSSKKPAGEVPGNLIASRFSYDSTIYKGVENAKTEGEQKFFIALLKDKKQLDAKDSNGRGLFHWIVFSNQVNLAQGLVNLGLRKGLLEQDNDGNIPMALATSGKMITAIWSSEQVTVRNKKQQTPLIAIAEANQSDALKEAGFLTCNFFGTLSKLRGIHPLNAVDELQRSALHYAAINGDVNGINGLISCDSADLNGTDRWRRTPLHYAAMVNDGGKTVSALAEEDRALAGTLHLTGRLDIDAQDADGFTAADLAKKSGRQDTAKAITSLSSGI